MTHKERLEYIKLLHQFHAAAFCCAGIAPPQHKNYLEAVELRVLELIQEMAVPSLRREIENGSD